MAGMTPKQRMVNLIRGEELDQLPFVSYHWMVPDAEVRELLGEDSYGVLGWRNAFETETPNCTLREVPFTTDDGREGTRKIVETPNGVMEEQLVPVPAMGVSTYHKHFVETADDLEVVLAYFEDLVVVPDAASIDAFHAEQGDSGIPHVFLPRTPWQRMWIEYCQIDHLVYLMADAPDLVEAVMTQMGEHFIETAKVTAAAAADHEFYHCTIGDNITAPAIGKDLYAKWCLPYHNTAADVLAEAGIRLLDHMDGDIKPLWDLIGQSHLGGIESLSPPPDNDTSVAEALDMWPEMLIWANFPSSVHLRSPAEIRRVAEELLAEGGHSKRFWIQLSEDMPPEAWRTSMPEILGAIRDFGKP